MRRLMLVLALVLLGCSGSDGNGNSGGTVGEPCDADSPCQRPFKCDMKTGTGLCACCGTRADGQWTGCVREYDDYLSIFGADASLCK